MSGQIGPLVFRQVGGQTIVQAAETKGPRDDWRYLAPQAHAPTPGLTSEATAHDRPGNATRHAVVL